MKLLYATLAVSVIAGCGSPTGISDNTRFINPEVVEAALSLQGDLLAVFVTLKQPIVMADSERLHFILTNDDGDLEDWGARPAICTHPNWNRVLCGYFLIDTPPERFGDLANQLRSVGGFIVNELHNAEAVRAYFPFGGIDDILATVGDWPGVRSVEPSRVIRSAAGPSEPADTSTYQLFALMRVEETVVAPGDGFLQRPGAGAIALEYEQPNGGPMLRVDLRP